MAQPLVRPRTTRHLEGIQRAAKGEGREAPPVARLIGISLVHADLGTATTEMDADPERHANPVGTLHGGIICDLADLALGSAMATTLEDDESFTTLDLTAKYFKPIWRARLRAHAQVTRRTRVLGLIECNVEDESGSLVARLFSTCMVLRGEDAKGR